jgi:hypothetical protein
LGKSIKKPPNVWRLLTERDLLHILFDMYVDFSSGAARFADAVNFELHLINA